jgi:hypothetical protein
VAEIHPFYEAHGDAMEASMRQRLDLAEGMLRERAQLADLDGVRQEVMDEFEIVLTQMPYVGGGASRMSDFFMRLMGFMAIGRVLRRRGVPLPVIGDIEREATKRNCSPCPKPNGSRQGVNSCHRKIELCYASRPQRATRRNIRRILSTISSGQGPATASSSASITRPAAFANSLPATETKTSCLTSVGSISRPMQHGAFVWNARKRWLEVRATAISDSRDFNQTKPLGN